MSGGGTEGAGGWRVWSVEPARRILLSAWADVGVGSYEWAVLKAWAAGAYVLAAPYGGFGPGAGWPSVAYMVAGLAASCRGVEPLVDCASTLDALAAGAQHVEVTGLLGVELGYGRREALDSIECSLKLLEALTDCARSRGPPAPQAPLGLLTRAVEALSRSLGEASIVDASGTLLIVVGEARGLTYAQRVRALPARLPPARLLILAPEEAAVLLALPSWRSARLEFIRDDYGLEGAPGEPLLGQP